jgi:hypothetical protein
LDAKPAEAAAEAWMHALDRVGSVCSFLRRLSHGSTDRAVQVDHRSSPIERWVRCVWPREVHASADHAHPWRGCAPYSTRRRRTTGRRCWCMRAGEREGTFACISCSSSPQIAAAMFDFVPVSHTCMQGFRFARTHLT